MCSVGYNSGFKRLLQYKKLLNVYLDNADFYAPLEMCSFSTVMVSELAQEY